MQFVVTDCRYDECGRVSRGVAFRVHDDARDVGETGMGLRRARFWIVFSPEQFVRARRRDAFQEIGKRSKVRVAGAFVIEGTGSDEV